MIVSDDRSASSLNYHSYLLRVWQSGPDGQWRASLQYVQSGETLRFADLASCLTFLQQNALSDLISNQELTEEVA